MDFSWLTNLVGPGNESLASTLVLYSFVIAAGVYLGKLKVAGVSLGVTFVLFVGILMGHFGYVVNAEVLKFVREFGLILFIFSIGLQVGPGFFSSFKKGGVLLNGLAVLGIALNVVIVLAIFYIEHAPMEALVGIMSGAVTNTPGLAAAQQTADSVDAINTMAMGYAAAYPLGVCGIIGAMFLIKAVFRINTSDEIKAIEDEYAATHSAPHMETVEVTNPLIEGKTLRELHDIIQCDFVISRLYSLKEQKIIIPTSATEVHAGDKLFTVISEGDASRFESLVGPEVEMDWDEATPSQVVSRRIVITKTEYNGVALGSLRLHQAYQLNCTRVNRAGVDLLASPQLRLQMGDRITVVGDLNDIDRLASRLGAVA